MTKVKLKLPFLFLFIIALVVLPVLTLKFVSGEPEDLTDYTIEEVVEPDLPVVAEPTTIINPYLDQSVTIKKEYYDYKADEEKRRTLMFSRTFKNSS